jgi:hypothetical protein
MTTKNAAAAVTTHNRTAAVDVARLEHLVRALHGALWRVESHVSAMERACEDADDMPSLRRVLNEDVLEVSIVAAEAAGDIYEMIGVPTMDDPDHPDPLDNYAEYREESRRRSYSRERQAGGAA